MSSRSRAPRERAVRKRTGSAPARGSKRATGTPRHAEADAGRLLYQLEVHQAELETQNEELRSARVDVETALARYTELFDFAPIGYAVIDGADIIRKVNHVGARLLGIQRAQIVGVRFSGMLSRDGAAAFTALAMRVRASEQPGACEVRLMRDDGSALVLHVTATAQPHDAHALLLAFEDITSRKAEQERLAETDRALREANRRKDEFLAMLSHELRNPLAPIRTSLFVLANTEAGSAAADESRAIIERQVAHLTRLVDDLLDMTRISRGKVQLRRERVDLAELVQHTLDDHRPSFASSGVLVGVAFAPGPMWVDVDPARIVQAVSNLLGNANKFTPRGGRVEISLQRRDGEAELRVHDTGAGIAPDLLPHVFEPFTQAPQPLDRKHGGLGLGLAMVKGFVELHGGHVHVVSAGLGHGAEIVLQLPLATKGPVAAPQALPKLARRRVLVIEDQPDAARALDTALSLLGLEVRVVDSGAKGLDVARAFRPEVVLCDIGLPGMNGHDVARTFRRDPQLRDTYLVALSGYAQPEDVERATKAGFSRHVAKPASLDTLVRVIAEAR